MTLAHVGHWIVDLIYVVPLLLIGAAIVIGKLRDRGRDS